MLTRFYIGSTGSFAAAEAADQKGLLSRLETLIPGDISAETARGFWNGLPEDTLIITADIADDTTAAHISYWAAVETGNAAVLFVRDIAPEEAQKSFQSVAAYRVTREAATMGDRTETVSGSYRYSRDVTGGLVARLIWRNGMETRIDS